MILAEISNQIKERGFEHFGFKRLNRPVHLEIYRQWIKDGCHGDMSYLERHLPIKEDPTKLLKSARSIIVITKPYYPVTNNTRLRVALYAQSRDYHLEFFEQLTGLAAELNKLYSNDEFLCYTDSQAVAERYWATLSGIGWIGKNSCLIHPKKGSLFFLGGILTSLDLDQTAHVPDFCGTCDACIRSCPTQAIRENRTLDSRRCISYWTIEAKGVPPENLRKDFSDWFFGCDICQTVCPWNEKVFGKVAMNQQSLKVQSDNPTEELRFILTASNADLEQAFKETPLLRARPTGLRRNAIIVAANLRERSLAPEIQAIGDRFNGLKSLVDWALLEISKR